MTLEIKSERRNLTLGSGEPAITHEEAINTLKEFLRAEQIAEMATALHQGLKPLRETYDTETIAAILYEAGYRKQTEGEWISHLGYEECGECHAKTMFQHNFCPNCGRKMKGDESDDRN